MKKLMIGVIALVVIVGALAFYLYSSLDGIVKTAIERIGSEVAGAKVTVAEVKISLSEGKGVLRGLQVGNPDGFTSPSAIRLGEVILAIDTSTITKDPVVISLISVAAPAITYEINASGASNIQAIQAHVQAASSHEKSEAKESKPKLVVDKFDVTKGKVALATPIPGAATDVALPDIHLTGIGRGGNGASPAAIASQILDAVSKSTLHAAASANLGQVLKNVGGSTVDTGKAVDGLKGLLGK